LSRIHDGPKADVLCKCATQVGDDIDRWSIYQSVRAIKQFCRVCVSLLMPAYKWSRSHDERWQHMFHHQHCAAFGRIIVVAVHCAHTLAGPFQHR